MAHAAPRYTQAWATRGNEASVLPRRACLQQAARESRWARDHGIPHPHSHSSPVTALTQAPQVGRAWHTMVPMGLSPPWSPTHRATHLKQEAGQPRGILTPPATSYARKLLCSSRDRGHRLRGAAALYICVAFRLIQSRQPLQV
eukprot:1137056-Pelagomonas_calceolata.AAC.12